MEKSHNQDDLQFILCPGRNPDPRYLSTYNQIYRAWHQLWIATYAELKDDSALYSDAFTRQDFIASIFLKGQCQAFILFRHADLSQEPALHDSYFQQWSEIHRKRVAKTGQHVLICGNLGIVPNARQESLGFSMKHLMMGFITEIALQSQADSVISTPRKDRGVHSAVYRWGGVSIAQNIDWGLDVVVDLTAFYKKEVMENRDHELVPLVENLWKNMLVIPENPLETVNSFLNTNKALASKFKKAG
jgi:hypothetical protein